MAELIEMLFGLWAQIGPQNQVLDGGPQVLRDVAMATNFWLSTGCLILGWVFGVKLSDEDIAEYLRVVAMATNFGLKLL